MRENCKVFYEKIGDFLMWNRNVSYGHVYFLKIHFYCIDVSRSHCVIKMGFADFFEIKSFRYLYYCRPLQGRWFFFHLCYIHFQHYRSGSDGQQTEWNIYKVWWRIIWNICSILWPSITSCKGDRCSSIYTFKLYFIVFNSSVFLSYWL